MYVETKFVRIEDNRPITRQEDSAFFLELQRGVLLSLEEFGILTRIQVKQVEEALEQQYRETMPARMKRGGNQV